NITTAIDPAIIGFLLFFGWIGFNGGSTLKAGDEVTLFTNQRSYTYVIVDSKVVEPTAVEVMGQTKQPSVTLISCYPYLVDDQRIVVIAQLQSSGG
ncbi:MAG: sortase domain-containing protein, partial [Anaerolineales bacterium]